VKGQAGSQELERKSKEQSKVTHRSEQDQYEMRKFDKQQILPVVLYLVVLKYNQSPCCSAACELWTFRR
jgi:hypothetical protein